MVPNRSSRARGGAYLLVLGTTTIVAILGLSGLLAARLQHRAEQTALDFMLARQQARAGIELGVQIIASEPTWRTSRGAGLWLDRRPLGQGLVSLEAADPVDGNMAYGLNDPVLLTSTATCGRARYKLQARVDTRPGLACLEVALVGGNDVLFDNMTLRCDQVVTANRDLEGKSGAQLYTDAQAAHDLKGGTFYGQTAQRQPPRPLPDSATVLGAYNSATPIAYTALDAGGANLLVNTDFEAGLGSWSVAGGDGTLSLETTEVAGGSYAARVSNRTQTWAGPLQDVTGKVSSGKTYTLQAAVRMTSQADNVTITLHTYSSSSGHRFFNVPAQGVTPSGWRKVSGTITPAWSGTLYHARWYVETTGSLQDILVDDARMLETSQINERRLSRVVLSPAHNPFGAANGAGLYRIDCGNKKLVIEDCRIVGTLVLENVGPDSIIRGSVSWEAGLPHYPVLLADKPLTIALSSAGLSESVLGVNFNPGGTPYPYPSGAANTDRLDAYPSRLKGLVYVRDKLSFAGDSTIEGVVLSGADIEAKTGSLNLRYRAIHLNQPPPGFDSVQRIVRVTPGSWRQQVD